MIVGFTGTRLGMSEKQRDYVDDFLSNYANDITAVHHGDCVGADEQFDAIAHRLGLEVVVHPPINPRHRAYCEGLQWVARDYMDRNQDIVVGASVVLATPAEMKEQPRGGTWATIRMCDTTPCTDRIVIFPDGTLNIKTTGSPPYAHG